MLSKSRLWSDNSPPEISVAFQQILEKASESISSTAEPADAYDVASLRDFPPLSTDGMSCRGQFIRLHGFTC